MSHPLQYLRECLQGIPQADYPTHSRVHLLRSFDFPFADCYVKRDDELGFGISGSKIRKYRSLIPFFIQNHIQEVVVIGSAYSNHVLSIQQLLIENQIHAKLFLRGDSQRLLQGNLLLTSLFASQHSIRWLSHEEWQHVDMLANDYAKQQTHSVFILSEGGFTSQALPGALSLALDIKENERFLGYSFDHIFIEAGTGFTAIALLLGLAWLKASTTVHIILLAEEEQIFYKRLKDCHQKFMHLLQTSSPLPYQFKLYPPNLTGKFGRTSPTLFKYIASIAQQEGFLIDPIYTAKLFIEAKHIITHQKLTGKILIHHAGGALTLLGFQDQIKNLIL